MKIFWTILVLLLLVAGVAMLLPSSPPTTHAPASPSVPAPVAPPTRVDELAKDLLTERASKVGELPKEEPATLPDSNLPLVKLGLDKTIKSARIAPGRIVEQPDGSLLADGKWVIKGKGTQQDPYIVKWELLRLAMETFQPREDLDQIPQAIALLDGSHVRVEGYVAFPLIAATSKQLITMMNQWDGCCIGLPPTAFDAIEVNLAKEVQVNRRHIFLYGTLEGTFHVEPNVIDNWLVGLYVMDDATLTIDL